MIQRLSGIACLIGGFVLLIALLHERMRFRLLRDTAVFTGRVIALRSCRTAGDPAFFHEATVAYSVNGMEYRSILRILPGEVLPLPGAGIRLSCFPWQPERLHPAPQLPPRSLIRSLTAVCVFLILLGTALCLPW